MLIEEERKWLVADFMSEKMKLLSSHLVAGLFPLFKHFKEIKTFATRKTFPSFVH
jgi:hypothetical protein